MTASARWLALATLPLFMASASHAQVEVAPPMPDPAPPAAANPPLKPSIITRPDWKIVPTGQQIGAVFPERALRQHVGGRAVIRCKVMASGKLTECQVVSETPEGYGFGAAVLKLSKHFIMRPQTKDGVPVDGAAVNIPINFRLD